MRNNSLLALNIFPTLKEISNFRSKEYSKFKKLIGKKIKNCFFNEDGNNLYSCHLFRNILQIYWVENRFKKSMIIGINTKELNYSISNKYYNILEFWVSSAKNFLKRVCLILIKGEGEIWQFSLIQKNHKDKKSIRIVLLFGTSIWIFDISSFLPQFVKIHSPFFKIELANLFQWKLCLGKNLIITGDICGKITILNTGKNLEVSQINHNKNISNPVGDLKLIEFDMNKRKLLITGGYDGILKVWSLGKKITVLKEIQFNNRWLVKLDSNFIKRDYFLIFVSFENGFESIVLFNEKIKAIKIFSVQGCSGLTYIRPNYIFNTDNDGNINFLEINSPERKGKNHLNLFYNRLFFFNWGIKVKINNTVAQSIGVKYQNMLINFQRNGFKKGNFLVSGFHGTIMSLKL